MRISLLKIDASACLFAALLLLTLPLKWLLAALVAAAFHELCHLLAIRLSGGQIREIRIGLGGTVMETEPLSRGQELFCAAAGPTGSLLLLLCLRWIPEIALCAGVQAFFNLLPVFPLDGGRILRNAAFLLLPEKWAYVFSNILENITVSGVLLCALAGTVWYHWGLIPLIAAMVLITKAWHRKIPCKEEDLGVQ